MKYYITYKVTYGWLRMASRNFNDLKSAIKYTRNKCRHNCSITKIKNEVFQ